MHRSDAYIAAPAFVAEDDDDDEEMDHYPGDEQQHRVHQLKRFDDTLKHHASADTRMQAHEAAFAVQEAQIKANEEHRRLLLAEEAELKAEHEEEEDVPEDYYGFPAEVLDEWAPLLPSHGESKDAGGGVGSDEQKPYDWPVDDDDDYGQSFDGFEDTGFTDKPPVIHLTEAEYKQQVDSICTMNESCVGLVDDIDPFEATSMGIWGNAVPGDFMVVKNGENGFDVLIDVGDDMPAMLVIKESKDGRYQYNDRQFPKLQAVIDDMARRPVKLGGVSVTLQRAVNQDGSMQPIEFRRSSSVTNNRDSSLGQASSGKDGGGGLSAEEEQQLRVTAFFNGKGTPSDGGKQGRPHSMGGPVEIVMVPPLGLSFYATPKLGCFVKRVKPGGAADSTGRIEVGMRMLAVNGQALNGLTHQSIFRMVKETQGTCAVVFASDPEGSAKMGAYQEKRANLDTNNPPPDVARAPNPLYEAAGGNAGGLVTYAAGTAGGGSGGGEDGDAVDAINRELLAANVSDGNGYVEVNVDGYLYGDGDGTEGTAQQPAVDEYTQDFATAFAGVSSPEPAAEDQGEEGPPAPPPRKLQTDADNNITTDNAAGKGPARYVAPALGDEEGMYSTTIVPDGIAAQINSMQRKETTRGKLLSSPETDVGSNGGYVEVTTDDGYLFGDGAGGGVDAVVGDADFTNFSRQEAEAKVTEHGQEGSYLLRPSTSCTSGRVLTAYFQGRVKHVQIDMVERGPAFHFRGMGQKNFASIRDLIDAYTNVKTFAADGLIPAPLIFAGL